jgi:hypothetical protein
MESEVKVWRHNVLVSSSWIHQRDNLSGLVLLRSQRLNFKSLYPTDTNPSQLKTRVSL